MQESEKVFEVLLITIIYFKYLPSITFFSRKTSLLIIKFKEVVCQKKIKESCAHYIQKLQLFLKMYL